MSDRLKNKYYYKERREDTALKTIMIKFSGLFAAVALMITAATANAACAFVMHQPEMPEGAKKLRKF